MARIAIVGDIHGAVDALSRLLSRVESHGVDVLVSLGDVLDRSSPSDCLRALRLIRERGFVGRDGKRHDIEMIAANHETNYCNAFFRRVMRFRDGSRGLPRPASPEIAAGLTREEYLYMDSRPRFLRIKRDRLDLLLVHGGVPSSMLKTIGWYGRERLDLLTRLGWLDEKTRTPLHPSLMSRLHWADLYRKEDGPRVLFGHTSWPDITRFENATGVDCSKHGRIAALVVSSEGEREVELYEETGVARNITFDTPAPCADSCPRDATLKKLARPRIYTDGGSPHERESQRLRGTQRGNGP